MERSRTLLLLLVVALLWFANIQYRALTEPDEARYAEISREMAVSGDWVTPRLNDLKYFEKPPLQYWATAAAYRVFGVHEWTARWYTTVLGFCGIFLVYGVGRRLWSDATGVYGAVILGSAVLWVAIGHINSLDMGLTFWLSAALGLFLIAQTEPMAGPQRRIWMVGCWAAIALAVLSKGLVALVLPAFSIGVYSLAQRDFGLWRRLHLLAGLATLLIVAAPWFVVVSMRNPEFAHFFFIHEHFERYLTTVHRRMEPWWYFIPIVLAGTLPWTWAVLRGAVRSWSAEGSSAGFRPLRFLLVWSVCILLFFSKSDSKLPPYILPMLPALALLGARYLEELDVSRLVRAMLPSIAIAVVLSLVATWIGFNPPTAKIARYAAYAPWLLAASAVLVVGAAAGVGVAMHRNARRAALMVWGFSGLLWAQMLLTGHNSLSSQRSSRYVAQAMQPHLTTATRLYGVGQYLQSVPFYLGRTMTLAVYRGELDMGIAAEPGRFLPTLEAFEAAWRLPGPALATVEPGAYAALLEKGLPMKTLLADARTVVIAKP